MGRFRLLSRKESTRLVRGYAGDADGRPGADFLNSSRKIRVSPLQLLSARKGIQVVPRKNCVFSP